ncbi:GAF domain-containing protein [bacterium]|jgi:signal transduction histidine kinase|nr:GAF domain-containing protein [bacterium]MBT4648983.1 GAF domain-containing protein [bacterium]
MLLINFLLLISFLINLFFGFFVLLKRKSVDYTRLILGLISVVVAFWCLSLYLYRLNSDVFHIELWGKIAHIFGALLAPLFLFFVFYFIYKNVIKRILFKIVLPSILFIIVAILLLFTDWIIGGGYVVNNVNNVELFFGYYIYIFYLVIHFNLGFILLIKKYTHSNALEKEQIKYILIGTVISSLGAIIFDLVYPIFVDFSLNWVGPVVTITMVVSMAYAIIRYRLMNIKLILARSILYTILVGTVASFFAFLLFYIGPILFGDTNKGRVISTIISSILIVLLLDPIKRVWAKITDSIFYKDKINYQQVLRHTSGVIAREIDLDDLLANLTKLLATELKLKQTLVLMPRDNNFTLIASSAGVKSQVQITKQTTQYFVDNHGFLITEELIKLHDDFHDQKKQQELNHVIQELEQIKAEMVIPIVEADKTVALLVLDRKLSGDIYDSADIDFFKILAPQIATAIEKSKLYEEVQELNRDLQAKVDERTKSLEQANADLESRNRYLTTMQVILNMISRSLDLKKVTQMIADSIASELGYIGGVLSFVNGDGKLRVKAVTQNHKAKTAIDLLPEDIFKYKADLKHGYNLGVDTVLSAKINFSPKMTDFFSPPVDEGVIDKIQEHLGVKTIIGIPIFSEDKIIGIVHFLVAVEREKISSLDIEMMTSLTNQVGIVSRNLELYENLQKVNKDLHEANTHLKVLDKAKSEFLSIASHQLRTPISAIKGYLSMMIDGDFGKIPNNISKLISDLFESASRLARTINVFLNVSRIEAGRLKLDKHAVQIDTMVTSVITELQNAAINKGIKLSYIKSKQEVPLIYADNDKLREVVLNLIDNAIKYTPKGSIEVFLEFNEQVLTFISRDTGIGIHTEEARTLFRKFVRGDGVAQIHTGGSGLGLFIAQKIVKEHDGRIWVESEGKGKGSVFKFEVPIATEKQIADASAEE